MIFKQLLYTALILGISNCYKPAPAQQANALTFSSGQTLATRIAVPVGYTRLVVDSNSIGAFLRSFPLKANTSKVHLYNGLEKNRQDVHAAVLDIDVGDKDLQQCADAVMRLHAEYLYRQKRYSSIHFNFTNGFRADYNQWARGYRIRVKGNDCSWYKAGKEDGSYGNFKSYLQQVFTYAGTLSLSRELKAVKLADIRPGDVFIKGGSPGHAVTVMDVAENKNGQRLFLIAQSYMPAQEIHLLKNFNDGSLSPWYNLEGSDKLYSPEWTFEKTQLMRFAD